MTMITPSYLGETIEYSSLHACRSTLEDPTSENEFKDLKNSGFKVLKGGRNRMVKVFRKNAESYVEGDWGTAQVVLKINE